MAGVAVDLLAQQKCDDEDDVEDDACAEEEVGKIPEMEQYQSWMRTNV